MTSRYSSLDDLIADLDNASILDDDFGMFSEDDLALLQPGPRRTPSAPTQKKRGRPPKKDQK